MTLLTIGVSLALVVHTEGQQSASEYQVKAAYLYNFAKLTQWPARALPAGSSLTVCVLGGDEEFPRVLRNTLAGKSVSGHAIEIRRTRSSEELKFCHVAFLRASERDLRSALASLDGAAVLLVGESREFLEQGGMIGLLFSNGKVTYEVNSAALEHASVHYDGSASGAKPDVSANQSESTRPIRTRVQPEYPEIAARMKILGAVQVQAVVEPDGTVKEVRVIGGHPVLAEAAVRAVMRWRFESAPKETTESLKINFGE